jgi:hypothetical protein
VDRIVTVASFVPRPVCDIALSCRRRLDSFSCWAVLSEFFVSTPLMPVHISEVNLGTSLQELHYQDSFIVPEHAKHGFTCCILHLEFVLGASVKNLTRPAYKFSRKSENGCQ